MFFLLRCTFWLGLTFSQLPWPQDAATVSLPAAASVGAAVLAKACRARPSDCLAGAAALARSH